MWMCMHIHWGYGNFGYTYISAIHAKSYMQGNWLMGRRAGKLCPRSVSSNYVYYIQGSEEDSWVQESCISTRRLRSSVVVMSIKKRL